MQISSAFLFLLIGFVSAVIAVESNHADCDAQQRLAIGKTKMALIERDARSVMELCGNPIVKSGDYPDQIWYYYIKLQQGDVTRITGFSVIIIKGKVFDVREVIEENIFDSQTGLIGSFAGYIGKDATQRDVILSFQSSKPLASLSREDKVRILHELQRRIALAKQRGEKILLPRSCAFVKLAADILEKHGSPFAPFMLENELVVDLQREGEKIVLVLDMLAKPKLQDK